MVTKSDTPPKRVLIVEDERATRALYRQLAIDLGCAQVFAAASGPEALMTLEAHTIDVIVTDLHMPVMGGPRFIANVRALNALNGNDMAGVIVLTGDAHAHTVKTAMKAGADFYVVKPVSAKALAARLSAADRLGAGRRLEASAMSRLPSANDGVTYL